MKYEFEKQRTGLKIPNITIWFLISFTWLLASKTYGAQVYSLNDLHVIEAEISRQGLTRITVKDDRILNVFGITGEYVLETDEDQGQIFIRPMGPGSLNPISLTLTTEKGRTQDLHLSPKDKAPEALILQAAENSAKQLKKKLSSELPQELAPDFPSRESIEELIKACQEDRIPVGYKKIPLDIIPMAEGQQGGYRLIRELRGTGLKGMPLRGLPLKGLTYAIKNEGVIPWILAESDFAGKLEMQVIAILMPKKILNPGESTHVYVIATVTE